MSVNLPDQPDAPITRESLDHRPGRSGQMRRPAKWDLSRKPAQADGPQGSSRHSAVEILTGACAADLDASVKAGELHRFFTVLPSGIER